MYRLLQHYKLASTILHNNSYVHAPWLFQNLAYQNEVYGQPAVTEEKDVKVLGMEYGKEGQPMPKY